MRIAFIWSHGGPQYWNANTFETGIGGAESMMIGYAEEMARRGHQVRAYTAMKPRMAGTIRGVEWVNSIDSPPPQADVCIAFREWESLPYVEAPIRAVACIDPWCAALDDAIRQGYVNLLLFISKYQQETYRRRYDLGQCRQLVTSAGARWEDYPAHATKEPGLCIHNSSPERGVAGLLHLWPRIQRRVPEARLIVTGGFQLYGWDADDIEKHSGALYRAVDAMEAAEYVGPLSRSELVELQSRACAMLYPGAYDENCCVAALEAMAAQCAVVATARGALPEVVGQYAEAGGMLIEGSPGEESYDTKFVDAACLFLGLDHVREAIGRNGRSRSAKHRFSAQCARWEQTFEEMLR